MMKKFGILMISLFFLIFFTTISLSQTDTEETTENTETTETTTADAEQPPAEEVAEPAVAAKVFYDGKNTYVNSSVQFKLSSKDNISLDKIEYRINNGETKIYEQPFSIDTEGKNVISFYGVDKIGNKEDVKVYKIVVDSSAPTNIISTDKAIAKVNDKIYVSKEYTFTIESKDALSGVNKTEFLINDERKEYITPFNLLSDGDVVLKIESIDNVNNSTAEFSFKYIDAAGKEEIVKSTSAAVSVDNSAPTVEIKPTAAFRIGENNKKLASPEVKYNVIASDDGAGVDTILYRVDGKGEFLQYLNEIKFINNGEHTIEALAVDKVGNTSNVSTLSVFVDVLAPETKIETIPE